MYNSDHPFKNFFTGALFGSVLGALAAFLFGTSKGRRMKKELMHKCHDIGCTIEDKIEDLDLGAKKPTKRRPKRRKKHK